MASTMLPFLYQTRTLQRFARAPMRRYFSQTAQVSARRYDPSHDAIPFDGPIDGLGDNTKSSAGSTTMTLSEAEVFKSIFDDISQGNLPRPSKSRAKLLDQDAGNLDSSAGSLTSSSLVEQARQARL